MEEQIGGTGQENKLEAQTGEATRENRLEAQTGEATRENRLEAQTGKTGWKNSRRNRSKIGLKKEAPRIARKQPS